MQNATELLDGPSNSSFVGNLTETVASTIASTTTTVLPSTASTTAEAAVKIIETTTTTESTIDSLDPGTNATSLAFFSFLVFFVAAALIAKIVLSHKKKRAELIGGSARWRISASRQSAASATTGSQQNGTTSATYLPMGRGSRTFNQQQQPLTNGLDNPGPDRLDWERQFFDDSEATTEEPSRLIFR